MTTQVIRHLCGWSLGSSVRMVPRVWSVVLSLAAYLVCAFAAHSSDYKLAPGDVLRVAVIGAPELATEVAVELDGTAWFPLIGPLQASGVSLADIRENATSAYTDFSLSSGLSTGGGLSQVIEPHQIHISVARYRPVYVSGIAGLPSEVPFRAGITLRHILAMAAAVPQTQVVQRSSGTNVDALYTEITAELARIWRLKTLLGTASEGDYERIFETGSPDADRLVAVEKAILEEAQTSFELQKERRVAELQRLENRITLLKDQLQNERRGLEMDEAALDELLGLEERGLVQASRLAEARRAVLVAASRVFQIDVALDRALSSTAELEEDAVAAVSRVRVSAWEELGEAELRLSLLDAELAAAGDTVSIRPLRRQRVVVVIRENEELERALTVPSLALMPGDIVDISFAVVDD